MNGIGTATILGLLVGVLLFILTSIFLPSSGNLEWEYTSPTTVDGVVELSDYGSDGWELIAVTGFQASKDTLHYRFFFKREKK